MIISDANEYRGVLLHRTANRFPNFSAEGRHCPINVPSTVQLPALGFAGFRVLGVGFTIVYGCPCKTSAKLLYLGLCSLTRAAMGSRL